MGSSSSKVIPNHEYKSWKVTSAYIDESKAIEYDVVLHEETILIVKLDKNQMEMAAYILSNYLLIE